MTTALTVTNDKRLWPALLPVGYALAVTLYVALRYGYRWGEQDTGQFVDAIHHMLTEGTIAPSGGAYPHGYAYQAIATALVVVTGLDVTHVLLIVLPFLTLVTALIAFVAFRALTGNAFLGGLSALLLFIQPEFLFVIERGNHEKVSHTLVLMLVFLLVASLTRQLGVRVLAGFLVAFYLGAWALISTNSFFASSFMASLVLSLIGGSVMLWAARSATDERRAIRRLIYTILSCFALFFIFVVYIYAPARHNFSTFRTLIEKLSVLFLSFEPQNNPYETISASAGSAWIAVWIYPILTAFNWLIVAGAAAAWIWLAVRFQRQGVAREQRHLLLLWLLAGAFAFEVAISIAVDLSGFLGSNLQIRLFPLFMLFGIPLAMIAGISLAGRIKGAWLRRSMAAVLVVLLGVFAISGVLKATLDPLVSNKWLFFTGSEQRALAWTDSQLERQEIWEGFDERLREMQIIHQPTDPSRANRYVINEAKESTRYIALSNVIQQQSVRLKTPAPNVQRSDQIYDNGATQIYHHVPETPYQP